MFLQTHALLSKADISLEASPQTHKDPKPSAAAPATIPFPTVKAEK